MIEVRILGPGHTEARLFSRDEDGEDTFLLAWNYKLIHAERILDVLGAIHMPVSNSVAEMIKSMGE